MRIGACCGQFQHSPYPNVGNRLAGMFRDGGWVSGRQGIAESGADVFISYTEPDRAWAEWIAWQVEAIGYTVLIQAWDFVPGSYFVDDMHRATERAARTIMVLSRAYLGSAFATAEWQAAWASDPVGRQGRLLAVRVEDCARPGLLRQMVSVDIFGVPEERARELLAAALRRNRGKPSAEPQFPGQSVTERSSTAESSKPTFPGLPAVWNVPGRLATFTGREDLLRRVEQALKVPRHSGDRGPAVAITALRGLGGVGKTQLAVEYAWRHANEYGLVWWIDAEETSLVAGQLAALAPQLDLPAAGQVGQDAQAVLRWLARSEDWLIIFDNATSLNDIRPWLPAGTGHVLITSRHPAWRSLATRVDIDVLPRSESVAFLDAYVPGVSPQVAEQLAAELGDLPLALGQAAAYLESSEIPPGTYLERFRHRRSQMLSKGTDLMYGGSLDTAWSVTLEQLQADSPATVQLLELAAFCAPDPVPLSLFTVEPGLLPGALAEAVGDNSPVADLDEVVTAALAYSLCRRDGDAIQVHRLVQAVISSRLSQPQHATAVSNLARLMIAAIPGNPDDPATWPAWGALAPHILHLATAGPDEPPRFREVTSWFCWYLFVRGDNHAAHDLATRLYQTSRAADGPDHPATLSAAANLATILRSIDKGEAARTLAQDTLDRHRRLSGEDHPATLHAANNLVSCLMKLHDYPAARELAEDTLERSRRTLGPDAGQMLATAGNLAETLTTLGEHARARELAADTAARHQRLYGDDHRETMWAVTTLINALEGIGDIEAAHELAKESLARHRRLFGEDHPDTQAAAEQLSGIRASLNRQSAAEKHNHSNS
jgi:TIR domain-containing protein/tetratricopeptide repeat protein